MLLGSCCAKTAFDANQVAAKTLKISTLKSPKAQGPCRGLPNLRVVETTNSLRIRKVAQTVHVPAQACKDSMIYLIFYIIFGYYIRQTNYLKLPAGFVVPDAQKHAPGTYQPCRCWHSTLTKKLPRLMLGSSSTVGPRSEAQIHIPNHTPCILSLETGTLNYSCFGKNLHTSIFK